MIDFIIKIISNAYQLKKNLLKISYITHKLKLNKAANIKNYKFFISTNKIYDNL